ncbi:hypothetical protein LEP1GSC047_0441 [Leptospira inadai serovar Lyme str. 10]|uniref:Uncharacterized protein n=2 Tax=Leptospira inadai serovar Lyme TaxID=293084 RepID=V6H9C9_9LEPT|nr:hypothetical protein LEP1GSC047_0441 [Leptospira inadai serovar Lyme str. 10]PNV76921.1 hypothetical protein BES34_001195 [Leptospira inadai serovar Lyme]
MHRRAKRLLYSYPIREKRSEILPYRNGAENSVYHTFVGKSTEFTAPFGTFKKTGETPRKHYTIFCYNLVNFFFPKCGKSYSSAPENRLKWIRPRG